MKRALLTALLVASSIAGTGCKPRGRSVRAWIESRSPDGKIVAGASVEIDGESMGMTDERGLYRIKIRRDVGSRFSVELRGAGTDWKRTFTVGTDGLPVESNDGPGRIVAVLGQPEAPTPAQPPASLPPFAAPSTAAPEAACSKDDVQPCPP